MDKSKKDLERWEKAILPLFGEVMYTKVCTDCSIFTKNAQFMHVTQREAWDCGIACLLMVSKWLRDCSGKKRTLSSNDGETERTWMLKTMASESIWSVDLVHLLQKIRNIKTLEFSYLYASKSLQVDQHHRDLSYYVEDFSDDQSRVTRLFNQAKEEGWPLIQLEHQLELSQVVQLVSRSDCIAIALVDNAVLLQRLDRPYAGHYIIISGVETNEKNDLIFQIHNPDSSKPVDYISSSLFEKAWRARGTDEDIIFIVARAR
eukprot:CAMPEP_0194173588 /NCGR_PEP_ID=MMETSP0154-20130528/7873_1 /TAXON_ID=1049557 /ORGANISM="Thalassiothrix antarctica, Strain L6-D1" /LENGTH=260 /DNA_ID=CAMNT_0038886687 /DNA_START=193 /DNA_END=975 /DNA_ORIENTATION=-